MSSVTKIWRNNFSNETYIARKTIFVFDADANGEMLMPLFQNGLSLLRKKCPYSELFWC